MAREKINKEKVTMLAQEAIAKASELPMVRVNREEFLRKTFKDSPYLDYIIKDGPQTVYTVESLRKKADEIIKGSTKKTTVNSFIASLPSNPALAFAAAGIDVTQYFGFAINLALKIAYLYGAEDFNKLSSEEAQARITLLLGTMLGVEGASNGLAHAFKNAGQAIGKRVARQSLTKTTTWYPLIKSILLQIGIKINKDTVRQVISKSMLVVGAGISSAVTYWTFKPLGNRLSTVYAQILAGEFDVKMQVKPEFEEKMEHMVSDVLFEVHENDDNLCPKDDDFIDVEDLEDVSDPI